MEFGLNRYQGAEQGDDRRLKMSMKYLTAFANVYDSVFFANMSRRRVDIYNSRRRMLHTCSTVRELNNDFVRKKYTLLLT